MFDQREYQHLRRTAISHTHLRLNRRLSWVAAKPLLSLDKNAFCSSCSFHLDMPLWPFCRFGHGQMCVICSVMLHLVRRWPGLVIACVAHVPVSFADWTGLKDPADRTNK